MLAAAAAAIAAAQQAIARVDPLALAFEAGVRQGMFIIVYSVELLVLVGWRLQSLGTAWAKLG